MVLRQDQFVIRLKASRLAENGEKLKNYLDMDCRLEK